MKIQYMSDLHMEFGGKIVEQYPLVGNVLILAGDIHNKDKITKTLTRFCNYFNRPVIFVPGNHEYYKSSRKIVDEKLKELKVPNLYVLNPGHVVIDNILFIGATGWIDGSFKPINRILYPQYNDFWMIKDFNLGCMEWGRIDRAYIEKCLKQKEEGKIKADKVIVITHFIPILECIHFKYKADEYNPCFSNNWKDLVKNYKIDCWIFGHSHLTVERKLYGCKFTSNPFGYSGYEENEEFKADKVIEISSQTR